MRRREIGGAGESGRGGGLRGRERGEGEEQEQEEKKEKQMERDDRGKRQGEEKKVQEEVAEIATKADNHRDIGKYIDRQIDIQRGYPAAPPEWVKSILKYMKKQSL